MSSDAEIAESLLDQAEEALDAGNIDVALALCDEALAHVPDHPGAHFVRGDALRIEGALEEAMDAYRAAALGRPDHAASWASWALTCLEVLRTDDARRGADRAIREDPTNPEGWWVRSLIHERYARMQAAHRCLLHARFLDPVGFPFPPRLTDEEVEKVVDEAIGTLHPTLREYLGNVAILLEEVPSDEVLAFYDPPMSPLELLGYFSGHSLMERSHEDPWSQLPGTIVLFRKNLERHSIHRADLIEQLRITFYHEVGHFLGLDEHDLEKRGLD